jgi:hypothetical protein
MQKALIWVGIFWILGRCKLIQSCFSHSSDVDCLVFLGYINSLLAALSLLTLAWWKITEGHDHDRLNIRGHLRRKLTAERGTTVWNLTALGDSTQSGSHNVVKSLSPGTDMNEEYPKVGKLAVNMQIQTHTDDERIVSLVRFD